MLQVPATEKGQLLGQAQGRLGKWPVFPSALKLSKQASPKVLPSWGAGQSAPLNKEAHTGYSCSRADQELPCWTFQNGAAEELNDWKEHQVLGQGVLLLEKLSILPI